MEEKKEKKPVKPLLRSMEVGQTEVYDIERYNVVAKECSMLRISGLDFEMRTDRNSRTVTVTRTV